MSTINQLNATTEYYWLQTEAEDIVNKASALLWKLMGNAVKRNNWEVKPHEIVDGGLMIKVPLEHAASNSGGYGATTVIDQSKVNIVDAARFPWKGAYGSNTLNLDDLTQNTGDAAIISLTKQYMSSIKKSIRTALAADVIAASTGDKINGLGDLFTAATSTEYGSIAEDDLADWKTNHITTTEAISFEVMQKIFREPNMGEFAGTIPNFCVTTPTLRDGYERSLHPQQRYQEGNMVQAGWDNIMHKQAPIVGDPYVSSGVLFALNLNFLSLRAHKDYNFTTPIWVDKTVLGQPDIISANTRFRGNLVCSNRKMQVKHSNLTEPA